MKVTLVQTPIVWEDKPANFAMVRDMLSETSGGMIVLPELFATGFTMNSAGIAEDDLGPTETFLVELAQEKSAFVMGGVARKRLDGKNPSNCFSIASPAGEIICRYLKTHPFSFGDEDKNYTKGSTVETVEIDGVKVSPSICYDLRFPELYRIGVQDGAELFVVIANWPDKRNQHWINLLQARAIENQAYVVGVNRCGEDPNLNYVGSSMVVDYLGEIVADAGSVAGIVDSELDMAGLREWREKFPAIRDIHGSLASA